MLSLLDKLTYEFYIHFNIISFSPQIHLYSYWVQTDWKKMFNPTEGKPYEKALVCRYAWTKSFMETLIILKAKSEPKFYEFNYSINTMTINLQTVTIKHNRH